MNGAPIVFFDIAGPSSTVLRDFYASALDWTIDSHFGVSPESTGGTPGLIRQDPPEKILYFGVPDIVKALEKIKKAGGSVMVPRTLVPGVVTFALFTDPAGNRLGLAEFGSYPEPKTKR